MTVLIGHPTGTPFAHHAALAHFQAGRLEALCVPWMPSASALQFIGRVPGLGDKGERLARRRFAELADAPKVQGRLREWIRLAARVSDIGEEWLAHDANDWLMTTMRRECRRPAVTAVHSYEDCSLLPFEEAKQRGKACIYDMPIGFYPAWEQVDAELRRKYADWLPACANAASAPVRKEQKRREMDLADVVLVPSRFAEQTLRPFHPDKKVVRAPYGADLRFWRPAESSRHDEILRFVFAGQISIRKGIPLLIEAWQRAGLRHAELELVGSWHLSDAARRSLPKGVVHRPPCAPAALRDRYRAADVLVFPSYFEGFGLVVVEGMACGLPVLASDATIAPEIVTADCGRVTPAGDLDALVEGLRWFDDQRSNLRNMGKAARDRVRDFSWERYRDVVSRAVAPYV